MTTQGNSDNRFSALLAFPGFTGNSSENTQEDVGRHGRRPGKSGNPVHPSIPRTRNEISPNTSFREVESTSAPQQTPKVDSTTAPEPLLAASLVAPTPASPPEKCDAATSKTPRQHLKVDATIAQQMRDAVWHLCDNGRPRCRLNDLVDEALSAWLQEMQDRHNGGEPFPHRGSLR